MSVDKQKVLFDAPAALNRDDQPWQVTVEGDSIIGRWKWMDARFFAQNAVSDEQREYIFTVTLKDSGKWKEIDKTDEKSSGVNFSGGNINFGSSSSTFKGKTNQKSVSFGIGQNKKDGSFGMVKSTLDTSLIKEAIRGYLTRCGWKKAGLFG